MHGALLRTVACKLSGTSQDNFWRCELKSYLQGGAQESLNNLVLLYRHGEQVDLLQGLDLALQPGGKHLHFVVVVEVQTTF